MSKERPILFSTAMVQAILEERKTQTRRIIKPQPEHKQVHLYRKFHYEGEHRMWCWKDLIMDNLVDFSNNEDRKALAARCPYGEVGDILWVREKFIHLPAEYEHSVSSSYPCNSAITYYAADEKEAIAGPWRPSIHMPKELSRIRLEITDIKVERLQEITRQDAAKEGVCLDPEGPLPEWCKRYRWPEENFQSLWELINGKHSWLQNPWVWVLSFKRLASPVASHTDQLLQEIEK